MALRRLNAKRPLLSLLRSFKITQQTQNKYGHIKKTLYLLLKKQFLQYSQLIPISLERTGSIEAAICNSSIELLTITVA